MAVVRSQSLRGRQVSRHKLAVSNLTRTYAVIQIQFQNAAAKQASTNKQMMMSHGCTLDEVDYILNLHHAMMHKSLSHPRVKFASLSNPH